MGHSTVFWKITADTTDNLRPGSCISTEYSRIPPLEVVHSWDLCIHPLIIVGQSSYAVGFLRIHLSFRSTLIYTTPIAVSTPKVRTLYLFGA